MRTLVDANVLVAAGKVGLIPKLAAAAPTVPWQLTRAVFDELVLVPGRASLRDLIRPSAPTGTVEARLHARLAADAAWPRLGEGELSSIVAAALDPDVEFVTWDRSASWRALHELRGRTQAGHAWLRRLVEHGGLTEAEAHAIALVERRSPPSWWTTA